MAEVTEREQSIAAMLMGAAIGLCTDLGLTDADILDRCTETLAMIRAAQANPKTMAALVDLGSRVNGD